MFFLTLVRHTTPHHATQTNFEDSLIAKSFTFQFVNAYASLFYVAFISSIFYNWSSEDNAKYFQCNTYMGETEVCYGAWATCESQP